MKRLLASLLAMLMMLGLTACDAKGGDTLPNDVTYRVLMIGNSYTYYNDLWELFSKVGEGAGYTFEVDHVTQGGYYLDQHANERDPFGLQVYGYLKKNTYDFVFLQEQSTCPFQNYERFEAAVTTLAERVAENGAKCVLYQTWAREPGSPALAALNTTNAAMTAALAEAYQKAAATVGATVSPVGTAFFDVVTNHPEIDLYDPDTTHPSPAGSYLAALCHFATVTGADPLKTTFEADLDAETASVLKQAAFDAVSPETEE